MDRHRPSHRSHGSGGGKALASARMLPAGVTWERITELFSAALDHPPAERDTFLVGVCGDNTSLMTEVRSLLRSLGLAGDFLDPGTAVGPPLSPSLLAALDQAPLFEQFKPEMVIGRRYRVRALLGRGGAGEVYEAWDEELAIPVALKTLHFGAALGGDALRSLKQEAMLARAVVHPNVCRVYDLGCHGEPQNGVWFLTMEVLRGETLAERLRARGRLTLEAAWPLIEQMVAGLEAAHQAGVVHLDFKSGNVMLVGESGKEQAVITDFGLARTFRQMNEEAAESSTRTIVGTPAYMAPEQVRGKPAGPAADIYAFGIVLYEMVTGTLPFAGGTALEVAEKRLDADVPSPRTIVPELDERWESVIRRCLEREPPRRFARAADVARELAGLSAPVEAATISLPIPHSLPGERDRFVGREHELSALVRTIAGGARLVTLLGAGGMGKTRLAVRYGWQSLDDWPGGVWFCDLTSARDENGIASAVSNSLNVPLGRGDLIEQLGQAIVARNRCLVILDNSEQVAEQTAAIVQRLTERAREAVFLITSRVRLGAGLELVLDLEPMSLESGLELFIERSKWLRPGLELGPPEIQHAREVVRLVEGIPLAIELAAARIRVMSLEQLVVGMRKRFSLLTGGPSERHETLTAAIDGSWDLLASWEKAALAQCSVFEGGFTLRAAEAVLDMSAYSEAPWTVDVIRSLMDKSLLRSWVPGRSAGSRLSEPRFGMFVSLQEYTREKLVAEGTIPEGGSGALAVLSAEERHGRWYAGSVAKKGLAALDQRGGVEERRTLGNEFENMLAGSRRAAARGDGETATMAYRAVWAIASTRGPYAAAVELGEVVAAAVNGEDRANALMTLGLAERSSGRFEEALVHFEEALALDRAGTGSLASALHGNLAGLHCDSGRDEQARIHFEAALAISRQEGDRRLEGIILANLGNLHRLQGRLEEGCAHYQAALVIHRDVGNRRSEGIVLSNLGYLLYEQGRAEEARSHFDAALAIHREVGDRRWEGVVLGDLGCLLCDQGRMEEARSHHEAALAIQREVGNRRTEGIVLGNLGNVHRVQGDKRQARDCYEAALAIHREAHDGRNEGVALGSLGVLHYEEGRTEEARGCYEAALAIHRVTGNRHFEGVTLGHLADLHYQQGGLGAAREALAQGEALLRATQARNDLAKLLCIRAKVEHTHGDRAFARAVLDEVEALASEIGAGPGSELGRALFEIRRIIA